MPAPEDGFIKVDAEGHEHEVLKGAVRMLNVFHPILAVSAYHKPADRDDLPRLLTSIAEGYDHMEVKSVGPDCELEMFAWPSWRAAPETVI